MTNMLKVLVGVLAGLTLTFIFLYQKSQARLKRYETLAYGWLYLFHQVPDAVWANDIEFFGLNEGITQANNYIDCLEELVQEQYDTSKKRKRKRAKIM